ncbi:MAG: transcription-repair coupling factor [Ruminococcaceae bacterium]|nr:transcription-repair coupling factor [Oscillospiraceae bacterium]
MNYPELLLAFFNIPEVAALPKPGDGGTAALISGLPAAARAHFAAGLHAKHKKPLVFLCPDDAAANEAAEYLQGFLDTEPGLIRSRDIILNDADAVSRDAEQGRIAALFSLYTGSQLTIITAAGLMQRAIPPDMLQKCSFTLQTGDNISPEDAVYSLMRCGYKRAELVEATGQFSLRGGILDFYSPGSLYPVRADFWGDEIDSLGYFDVSNQRRINNIEKAIVLPAAETLVSLYKGGVSALSKKLNDLGQKRESREKGSGATLLSDASRLSLGAQLNTADRYAPLIYGKISTAIDYLPSDCIIVMDSPGRFSERAREYAAELLDEFVAASGLLNADLKHSDFCYAPSELFSKLSEFSLYMAEAVKIGSYPIAPTTSLGITAKQLPPFLGNAGQAISDASYYRDAGYRTVLLSSEKRRADTLLSLFAEAGIPVSYAKSPASLPAPGTCLITEGGISQGIEYPELKLALLSDRMLIAASQAKRELKSKNPKSRDTAIDSFYDLSVGDLIVHNTHGIGRFSGMQQMTVDGAARDYVKISFAGTDILYLPATAADSVYKYVGSGEHTAVRLSKLGGAEWQNTKSRAKAAAKDLAKELIALYSKRLKAKGHAFSPDTPWQAEFEDSFIYTLTDDQLSCTNEIKRDMEKEQPMDRLLCGDVGFGKTEVAMRAVMKCIMDGKQAALLAPTTVLAAQHYKTAVSRFFGYPVNIGLLSRFVSRKEAAKTVSKLKSGECDFIIGTHSLLSKDIGFKNLGLLIVDEEQRFGVGHKEHIKAMSHGVDILSLSATPIPRTLNMAMSGVRDLSVIEEPPEGRLPVSTYVMEHDMQLLADAMRRELKRGGQVYYLHNKISSIDRAAAKISAIIPEATIRVAHGRMGEDRLSRVMEDMAEGRAQILVCTTIIETGIDISNVNTLIIEDADKLGLAQLHQLRGRVGRSSRRASAYLTYKKDKIISEIAEKRLTAVREFAEFNSGVKIAMRDLELRGAGNLLGAEQSGHMFDVGYDMYIKLLREAVSEEKGESVPKIADCSADLAVTAGIPESYIAASEMRMSFYRRIALIRSDEDSEDVIDELLDRFGEIPPQTMALIRVACLRGHAGRAGITDISQKSGSLIFTLESIDAIKLTSLYERPEYKGRLKAEPGNVPRVSLRLMRGQKPLDTAEKFTSDWGFS